jgi:hypothetical protein
MGKADRRMVIVAIGEDGNRLVALNPDAWVDLAAALCTFVKPDAAVRDVKGKIAGLRGLAARLGDIGEPGGADAPECLAVALGLREHGLARAEEIRQALLQRPPFRLGGALGLHGGKLHGDPGIGRALVRGGGGRGRW